MENTTQFRDLTYGLSPKIICHTAHKFGKYYDGIEFSGNYPIEHPCDGVVFYLWGNRFEMTVDLDRGPVNMKERFDAMFSHITSLGFRLDVQRDEIHCIMEIYYDFDSDQLYRELKGLGFERSDLIDDREYSHLLSEYEKMEDGKKIKIEHRNQITTHTLTLDCHTEIYDVFYGKLIDIIEKIKLPKNRII